MHFQEHSMQKIVAMATLLALAGTAPAADNADLAAIRAQIDEMKKSYEQRIAALEKKLAQAESRAEQQVVVPSPPVAAPASSASAFNPEVSLILQGQYRNQKDVPGRGITGFVPAGEFANKRGFSADETELMLAANIDPYWRGQAVIAMADGQANVEEAWIQSLAIGNGIGLKAGRFRSGIGYLNEQHPHQHDFNDVPLMYQAMFEEGAYVQDGVQLKWLAPTPLFVEFGTEFGRGASFPGSDRNKNGSGGGALYAHIGDDLGVSNSWRAGLSVLRTAAKAREADFTDLAGSTVSGAFSGDSTTFLADFVWKWAPNGNAAHQNFKFQSEYFQRRENGKLDAGAGADDYRTRQSGWYAQGVYQFTPNWRGGLRYEHLDSGARDFGANAANLLVDSYRPKRASVMVDYSWSEFSRLRLQYAQDKSMAGLTDNQVSLQYVMSLGAHGAHKF
jgi:hypothetical protein